MFHILNKGNFTVFEVMSAMKNVSTTGVVILNANGNNYTYWKLFVKNLHLENDIDAVAVDKWNAVKNGNHYPKKNV